MYSRSYNDSLSKVVSTLKKIKKLTRDQFMINFINGKFNDVGKGIYFFLFLFSRKKNDIVFQALSYD